MISDKRPICLLLGGNKLNAGVADRFHEWGCDVVVVDWNETPAVQGGLHLRLDVKVPEPIILSLKEKSLWERVQFGFTSIDVAVPSLASVLKARGLSVNTEEGLANSFSKSRQTKIWAAAGLLNRESRCYGQISTQCVDEVLSWNSEEKLIVKPDNAASSRGITVLERKSVLVDIERALKRAYDNAGDGLVVVEEFIEGTEFTVEMIGDGQDHVSVYAVSKKQHTKNTDRNKIAVKLHYNSVSRELQKKIADFGAACYKALGFRNSLGHLEVILKEDGTISPVEIGARSSGYIASHLVDAVSGRSFLRDMCAVYHGGLVPEGLRPQSENSSMYFFYDIPRGSTITHACTVMDFCEKSIRSCASDTEGLYVGRKVENIDNDNARLGMEVLVGPCAVLTEGHMAEVESRFLTRLLGEVHSETSAGSSTPAIVRELKFPVHGDSRGQLIALESLSEHIPFEVNRVYYIFDTTPGTIRGKHAHKALKQVLICVSGACTITCEKPDGTVSDYLLNWPDRALLIEGLVWRQMKNFSKDAVLLVLASEHYDESDYIRNYEEFVKAAHQMVGV